MYVPLAQRARGFFKETVEDVGDFAGDVVGEVKNLATQGAKYIPLAARRAGGVIGGAVSAGGDAMESALSLLREEEGLRTDAYQDQTGKWTIGFGNTMIDGRPVRPGEKITTQRAEQLMRESVQNQYTSFKNKIRRPLTPSQFAALTSFEYNLGSGIWSQAKDVIQKINAGDFAGAGALMQQYNKSRDPNSGSLEVNPVLAKRRRREAAMLSGVSSAPRVASSGTSGYIPLSQRLSTNFATG